MNVTFRGMGILQIFLGAIAKKQAVCYPILKLSHKVLQGELIFKYSNWMYRCSLALMHQVRVYEVLK